jgi:flagellar biosynthesis/type III secretory pathway chaperone
VKLIVNRRLCMALRDALTRERENLVHQLAELDARRSKILRELAVLDETLAKLDDPGEGAEQRAKRPRGATSGLERTRRLLSERPDGLTVTEIAEILDLQLSHASNIISALNKEQSLTSRGKRDGKNVWALAA